MLGLGDDGAGAHALAALAPARLPALRSFNDNGLDHGAVVSLLGSLAQARALEELDLRGNAFNQRMLRVMGVAMQACPALRCVAVDGRKGSDSYEPTLQVGAGAPMPPSVRALQLGGKDSGLFTTEACEEPTKIGLSFERLRVVQQLAVSDCTLEQEPFEQARHCAPSICARIAADAMQTASLLLAGDTMLTTSCSNAACSAAALPRSLHQPAYCIQREWSPGLPVGQLDSLTVTEQ
jgi:hypothetical protein